MWGDTENKSFVVNLKHYVSDKDSRIVIGRIRQVTRPIGNHINWVTNLKIRNVGLSFAKLEIDLTVYLKCLWNENF